MILAWFLTKTQSNEARELGCLSQWISGSVWLVLALLLVSLAFWLYEIYRSQHENCLLGVHSCTFCFIKSCLLVVSFLHGDKCLSAMYCPYAVIPHSASTLFFTGLALVRAAASICSLSQGNSCWLQALGVTLVVTSGSCQREIASKQDEFAPCRQCRAKILLAPLWGNVKDKGAVPSGCLLSERRCNLVVTKAGEEGTNLCEGKV